MGYPRKLLAPGEEIAAEARPNWSVLVRPVAITALLVAAAAAVGVIWSSAPALTGYVLAGVCLAALARLGARMLEWRSRLLVVTTTRVIYRSGVLRRTGREIPLDRVQDVSYHQTLLERLVGAGSLLIESAGAHGHEPFPDVAHPAEMQTLVNRLASARLAPSWSPELDGPPGQRTRGGSAHPRERDPTTDEIPVTPSPLAGRLEELERLHEEGLITDEELGLARRQALGLG